jgi:uronate dehydrogenase
MQLSQQTWVLTGAGGVVATSLRPGIACQVAKLRLLDIGAVVRDHEREEVLVADIRSQEALLKAFQGAYGVIHLAGYADEDDFHDLADVNIVGTFHVFEAARCAGVKRVLYASSNRVTGFYSTDIMVSPDMPPRPDGLYGVSKVAGESLARLYADKFGLEVAVLRIGSFENEPMDERQLSTWLSPSDNLKAFTSAMLATELTFSVFYAVSRNTRRWWDLQAGLDIGFDPQDDAETHVQSIETGSLSRSAESVLQGGVYATPMYTIERQKLKPMPRDQ